MPHAEKSADPKLPASASVAVACRELRHAYAQGARSVEALAGVSFEIQRGRMIALIGRSGSGKSTLLHLLGALDRPTGGDILIAGRSLAQLPEHQLATFRRRRLGFVFQAFHLVPSLNVFDNVALPFLLDRRLDEDRRRDIRDLLDRLGLSGLDRRFPDELSGGQQQRVALARAVVHQPDLLLADEPTGNLDTQTGEAILDLLAALPHERGVTVVMATHDADAADRCDGRLVLEDGRLIEATGLAAEGTGPDATAGAATTPTETRS